jgi:hypothetical protein
MDMESKITMNWLCWPELSLDETHDSMTMDLMLVHNIIICVVNSREGDRDFEQHVERVRLFAKIADDKLATRKKHEQLETATAP